MEQLHPDDIYKKLRACLDSKDSFGESDLLLAQIAGSHAFNLAVETSDEDLFGVFIQPVANVLCGEKSKTSLCSHDPDFETHELETYIELLEKGNPKVVEPIFTNHLIWKDPRLAALLSAARRCCLSQHTLTQYRHYAKSQKGDDAETLPKKRYHSLRLAFEGARIAEGLEPLVYLEGPQRDLIMSFRQGQGTQAEFEKLFYDKIAVTKNRNVELRERTNVDELEPFLIELRRGQMAQNRPSISQLFESRLSLTENPYFERASKALETNGLKDATILFAGKSGSAIWAQEEGQLSKDLSLGDVFAVFCAPLSNVLGLNRNRILRLTEHERILAPQCKSSLNQKGLVLIEASLFCSLLAAGNHRALEAVSISSQDAYTTPWFDEIRTNASMFVGKQPISHCFGMIQAATKQGKSDTLILKFVSYCEQLGHHSVLGISDTDLSSMREGTIAKDKLCDRISALAKHKDMPGYKNMQAGRDWIRNHLVTLRYSSK